jgi:PhnB protein
MTKPIPAGFHAVTPYLVVRGAAEAIEFYKKAFGAVEEMRSPLPGSKLLMHAQIRIGDSKIMMCDEMPEMRGWMSPSALNGTTVALHLYTEDTDALFDRAVNAGAKPTMKPWDAFWGDRYAKVNDPFGHEWTIATHVRDMTPEQMKREADEFFASFQKKGS